MSNKQTAQKFSAAEAILRITDSDESHDDLSASDDESNYQPSVSHVSETSTEEESDIDSNSDSHNTSLAVQPTLPSPIAVSSSAHGNCDNISDWRLIEGRQKVFIFNAQPGVKLDQEAIGLTPYQIYKSIISDEILEFVVEETNRYAISQFNGINSSRTKQWHATNREEMESFLGLLMWMSLVKMPNIYDYWSNNPIYHNDFAARIMPRNRFEILLRAWHFCNSDQDPKNDRLFKIRQFVDMVEINFQKACIPGNTIVIDETMVPFTGRLSFKQYIPGKSHKYGVKLYKLCDPVGYTYRVIIYSGAGALGGKNHAKNVVEKLAEPYLNEGRTLFTDNFYTGIELANSLLSKNTHLIGTLRKNRKGLPKDVINKVLRKGEVISRENSSGIIVMKWKDKKDVLVLSTSESDELISVGKTRAGDERFKPQAVVKYNKAKVGIDLSDQLSSYYSSLRRSLKWYRKVVIELLLGTSVINSFIIYNTANTTTSLKKFKEELVSSLVTPRNANILRPKINKHHLSNIPDDKRRACKMCYQQLCTETDRKNARNRSRKVRTLCEQCPDKPAMCLTCFAAIHK